LPWPLDLRPREISIQFAEVQGFVANVRTYIDRCRWYVGEGAPWVFSEGQFIPLSSALQMTIQPQGHNARASDKGHEVGLVSCAPPSATMPPQVPSPPGIFVECVPMENSKSDLSDEPIRMITSIAVGDDLFDDCSRSARLANSPAVGQLPSAWHDPVSSPPTNAIVGLEVCGSLCEPQQQYQARMPQDMYTKSLFDSGHSGGTALHVVHSLALTDQNFLAFSGLDFVDCTPSLGCTSSTAVSGQPCVTCDETLCEMPGFAAAQLRVYDLLQRLKQQGVF